jgi:ribosome-associated protein
MIYKLNGHEYIELNKFMKLHKWVGSGGEANIRIENGEVSVNGQTETQKRKKLRAGHTVNFLSHQVSVED